ncbi:MAG: hypothetical protein ABII25_08830 [bacterium]
MKKNIIGSMSVLLFALLILSSCNPFEQDNDKQNTGSNTTGETGYTGYTGYTEGTGDTGGTVGETTGGTIDTTTSGTVDAIIYANKNYFNNSVAGIGTPTIINFEDAPAYGGNTIQGNRPFDNNFYSNQGVIFGNLMNYSLFIAPGGLFWNQNNSLSVGCFPFEDSVPYYNNADSIIIVFDPPVKAVGFEIIDNGSRNFSEYIDFQDVNGLTIKTAALPEDYMEYRAFIGIKSLLTPIHKIFIYEDANDGDDINYDDIVFYR